VLSCTPKEEVDCKTHTFPMLRLLNTILQLIGTVVEALLGEYSRQNSDPRKTRTLYAYATGAQRQLISILSHLGICESYTSLAARPVGASRATYDSDLDDEPIPGPPFPADATLATNAAPASNDGQPVPAQEPVRSAAPSAKKKKKKSARTAGSLYKLSGHCRDVGRKLAATNLTGAAYDNINAQHKVAEATVHGKSECRILHSWMQLMLRNQPHRRMVLAQPFSAL
jgi:hypothetical protein